MTVCPKCGCPVKNVTVNEDVLNQGKGTEAETVISNYAKSILKWGDIIAFIACIAQFINTFVGMAALSGMEGSGAFYGVFFLGLLQAVLYLLVIKFIAKLLWAALMLFVNISTNLKRIEIQLEKYGTSKMS